jgi:hypothetical protein
MILNGDLMFCTSGFQISLFAAAACTPSALGPHMGGPFKGTYRAHSLNRTARAPLCAWEELPRAAAPVPAQPQNGPFAVPSHGARPGGHFLPAGAKGIPF